MPKKKFLGKFLHFVKFLFHKILKSLFFQGNFNWIYCLFWGKFDQVFRIFSTLVNIWSIKLKLWILKHTLNLPKMKFHLLSLIFQDQNLLQFTPKNPLAENTWATAQKSLKFYFQETH